MATIVHFNITAKDPITVKKFYEELFGWKITELPGPMPYYLVQTEQLNGRKGVGGGIAKREAGDQPGFVNFIGVKDIDKALKELTKRGGTVVQQKASVPGFGYLATCMDPEENVFGLFEEIAEH